MTGAPWAAQDRRLPTRRPAGLPGGCSQAATLKRAQLRFGLLLAFVLACSCGLWHAKMLRSPQVWRTPLMANLLGLVLCISNRSVGWAFRMFVHFRPVPGAAGGHLGLVFAQPQLSETTFGSLSKGRGWCSGRAPRTALCRVPAAAAGAAPCGSRRSTNRLSSRWHSSRPWQAEQRTCTRDLRELLRTLCLRKLKARGSSAVECRRCRVLLHHRRGSGFSGPLTSSKKRLHTC